MCLKKFMVIKSVHPAAPKFGFVPCGECIQCQKIAQQSWAFRLRHDVESLVKKGYWCGFVTLTYKSSRLPHIPKPLIKKDFLAEELGKPCFSKAHVRKLIRTLQKWIYDNYMTKAEKAAKTRKLVYLVSSEFGERTKRPHYHALLCGHPSIDPHVFYDKLCSIWRKYGFIIPKDYEGGYDGKMRYHKPFICESVVNACFYAAKYVCKDLSFYADFNKEHYHKCFGNKTVIKLRDFLPFHMQTRSLGLEFIKTLTSEEKLQYLKDGVSNLGSDKNHSLPVYFRNKLIFDNYYINVDGKRLVRRKANGFFKKHFREIYEMKVNALESRLFTWFDNNYWIQNIDKLSSDSLHCLDGLRDIQNRLSCFSYREIAEMITTFYGCDAGQCVETVDLALAWFERFHEPFRRLFDSSDLPLYDPNLLFDLNVLYSTFNAMDAEIVEHDDKLEFAEMQKLNNIKDFLFYQYGGL